MATYFRGDQGEEAIERFSGLLVSGSNTTELLDPIEHPPDAVSILVGPKVADGRGFPVCLAWDDRPDPLEWTATITPTSSSK